MRKSFLLLCIVMLFGVCACGNKDTNSKYGETKKTNTVIGEVYSIDNLYVNNTLEEGSDRTEIAVRVDEKRDGEVIFVTYYARDLEKKVASDGHYKIGDSIEIEYEGELEEIGEESGRVINEGEKYYRINNVVYVSLIQAAKD